MFIYIINTDFFNITYLLLHGRLNRFWFWFLLPFQDRHDGGWDVSLLLHRDKNQERQLGHMRI